MLVLPTAGDPQKMTLWWWASERDIEVSGKAHVKHAEMVIELEIEAKDVEK
jgi:hypothetical protein